MRRSWRVGFVALLGLAARSAPAATDPNGSGHAPERVAAELRAALEKATEADRPALLLELGDVYASWPGHCSEALEAYRRHLEICSECDGGSAAETRTRERCEVEVTVSTTPPDAVVRLDGDEWGHVTPHTVILLAGRHPLRVTRTGYEPLETTLELEAGAPQRFELSLRPDATLATRSTAPAPDHDNARKGSAWTSIGLGAAAVGALSGLIFAGLSLDAADRGIRARYDPANDPARGDDLSMQSSRFAALGYTSFIIAGLGLAGAIAVEVLAPPRASKEMEE